MSPKPIHAKEDLAKLHCLHNLFADATGEDLYLIQNLKEAIEQALVEADTPASDLDAFIAAALRLRAANAPDDISYGLLHLDLRERGFDPLFVRSELIAGFKRIAGLEHALVVVTGLRFWVLQGSRYMTARQKERYQSAIAYIDELALRWTTAGTCLNLIYF